MTILPGVFYLVYVPLYAGLYGVTCRIVHHLPLLC